MAHALRKYARHVQRELEERLSKRPPYQWCLRMVQNHYDAVRDATAGKEHRGQLIKDGLTACILPIGALQLQAEGRFRSPPPRPQSQS